MYLARSVLPIVGIQALGKVHDGLPVRLVLDGALCARPS
jgi:hypothetical protein